MVSNGRVGELEEEDLRSRDLLDRGGVVAAGEDVEAVEAGPDGLVVRELDDPPGATVVVDEPSPGERFEGDPDAVRRGLLAQPAQLRRGDLVVVDRGRGDVAAHEHRVDAEPLHERELRARPAQDALELRLRDALGVAERLVEVERQPEPCGERDDLLGAGRRGDQVGFEDLDAVEARVGGGVQLVGERAAEADGGDRGAHQSLHRPGGKEDAGRVEDHQLVELLVGRAAVEQRGQDPAGQVLHVSSAARAPRATTAASRG